MEATGILREYFHGTDGEADPDCLKECAHDTVIVPKSQLAICNLHMPWQGALLWGKCAL